ncbi:hypothetical protein HMPREF2824_06605 [Neisseria sp. HMSC063B05]|nr:hypothetical protein HMPREF2824_06605 [Neisseria sp. HMSC063B05]
MSNNSFNSNGYQTIFCDRIMSMSVSASVSKLDFGSFTKENENSSLEITTRLVIPTEVLVQTLPLLLEQISNQDMKNGLVTDLNKLINYLNNN